MQRFKMFLEGLKDMLNWSALLRKTAINQMVMPYNTILERSILDVLRGVSIPREQHTTNSAMSRTVSGFGVRKQRGFFAIDRAISKFTMPLKL